MMIQHRWHTSSRTVINVLFCCCSHNSSALRSHRHPNTRLLRLSSRLNKALRNTSPIGWGAKGFHLFDCRRWVAHCLHRIISIMEICCFRCRRRFSVFSKSHCPSIHLVDECIGRCPRLGQDWNQTRWYPRRQERDVQVARQAVVHPPSYSWRNRYRAVGRRCNTPRPTTRQRAHTGRQVVGCARRVHSLGMCADCQLRWLWRLLLPMPRITLRRQRSYSKRPCATQPGSSTILLPRRWSPHRRLSSISRCSLGNLAEMKKKSKKINFKFPALKIKTK